MTFSESIWRMQMIHSGDNRKIQLLSQIDQFFFSVGPLRTRPPITSAINSSRHTVLIHSLHMEKPSQYSPIRNTHQLPFYTSSLHAYSFQTLSIRDTPTKLLKHFISSTFTFLSSALLIPHASAPYNPVGRITPSYRHLFAFISNPLLFSIFFSTPHDLNPSFTLRTTSLSQPPSAATCDARYLKQSTSSNS